MATDQEKKKVGINEVNFLGLGEDSKGEDEEVIISDEEQEEEITQEQEDEETTPPEQEDDEIQEDETEDGDSPADTDSEEEIEEADEKEGEEGGDELSEDEQEEFSVFQSTAEDIGIELDDEDFEGIDFEDPDTNDLSNFINVVSDKIANKKYEQTVEQYPEVEGMIEFAKNGGDPRQYIETMYPQVDYTQVDFEEHVANNPEAQEQLVRNHLSAQETPEEEIDEMVEDFRNGGILEKQAKRSLKNLSKMQEKQQEQLVEKQEKIAEEQRKEAQKQQQRIKETIEESESIKGLRLPETDKDDLKNYLFEPVDDEGRSKAFIDGQQMDEEERIAIAYLKMKGFDFETLIENEAETKNAKRLKSQIKQNKEKEKPSSKRNKEKTTSGNVQDIKPII